MNVTIAGAAGYTGGMLLRLLARHPQVGRGSMTAVSASQAGAAVHEVHPDLVDLDMTFAAEMPEASDVIFLCMGHGNASGWMDEHDVGNAVVVDLSADHRANDAWVYGLPELNRDKTRSSRRIANPGCFATCIELSLLPLAEQGSIQPARDQQVAW